MLNQKLNAIILNRLIEGDKIMTKRFIIPTGDLDTDVTLIDTVTGKEYTDNFEDIVELMNDLDTDLLNARSRNTRLILLLKDVVLSFEKHSKEFIDLARFIRKNGNLEFNSGRTYDD